jgi:hypothetical protein
MKKPRFTEQQIAQALRLAEQGTTAAEVCRKRIRSGAACGMSISTSSCSSRSLTHGARPWSGNETTTRTGRTARSGTFPLGSSRPSGS